MPTAAIIINDAAICGRVYGEPPDPNRACSHSLSHDPCKHPVRAELGHCVYQIYGRCCHAYAIRAALVQQGGISDAQG